MNVIYKNIESLSRLTSAARSREPDIRDALGAEYQNAEVEWVLRAGDSDLTLTVREGDRQAAEPVSYRDLANGQFAAKLERLKEALSQNSVWRAAVRRLVDDVRTWCRALPDATVKDESVTLNEERGGKYELPALEIRSGGGLMWVRPVAGWVVNPTWIERAPPANTHRAVGRADLLGPGGPIYLYCLDPDGRWVYRGDAPHSGTDHNLFHPLTKGDFLTLARACLDG